MRPRYAGNTLTEYLFIAFLILVVAIAVLMTLGSGLNGQMTALWEDMHGQVANAELQTAVQAAEAAKFQKDNAALLNGKGGIMTYGANGGSAMTTGANGNRYGITGKAGGGVNSRNAILTAGQMSMFNKLSNQAFRISRIQSNIEMLARMSGSDTEKFNRLTVNFDGQPKTAPELIAMIQRGGELTTYHNLQKELMENERLMDNPSIADYVNSLSDDVRSKTIATRTVAESAVYDANALLQVKDLGNGEGNRQNGVSLCGTGGYKDDGGSCTSTVNVSYSTSDASCPDAARDPSGFASCTTNNIMSSFR